MGIAGVPLLATIAAGAVLAVSGCVDDPTTTQSCDAVQQLLDGDCDGIRNVVDRNPSIADYFDVDFDGIPNGEDGLPYNSSVLDAIDSDRDGLSNSVDRNPNVMDSLDVDGDGTINALDQLPYAASSIALSGDQPTTTTSGINCVIGYKPDGDGDGIPDYCDAYYDIGNRDSDGDGLADLWDPGSGGDYDNDGIVDSQDARPNDSAIEEQDRQEQRLEQQRYEDELRRRAQEEQDQLDDYWQQRESDYYDPYYDD
jgi:hypothetical protein